MSSLLPQMSQIQHDTDRHAQAPQNIHYSDPLPNPRDMPYQLVVHFCVNRSATACSSSSQTKAPRELPLYAMPIVSLERTLFRIGQIRPHFLPTPIVGKQKHSTTTRWYKDVAPHIRHIGWHNPNLLG